MQIHILGAICSYFKQYIFRFTLSGFAYGLHVNHIIHMAQFIWKIKNSDSILKFDINFELIYISIEFVFYKLSGAFHYYFTVCGVVNEIKRQ